LKNFSYKIAHNYIGLCTIRTLELTTRRALGSSPRENHDTGNAPRAAEVHHPDRLLDVEVVEYRAAVNAEVGARLDAVDGPGGVTVHPLLLSGVTLVLATTVDERLLLERQILNWTNNCQDKYMRENASHHHVLFLCVDD